MTPAQVGAQVAGAGPAGKLVSLIIRNDFAGATLLNKAIAEEMPFNRVVERWFVGRIEKQWPQAKANEPWERERAAADPALEAISKEALAQWAGDRVALAGKDRLADLGGRLEAIKPRPPEARKIAEELGPLEIEAAPSVSEIADVAPRLPRVAFAGDEPIDDAEPPELSPQASYDNAREFARRCCWKAGSLAVLCWGDKFWEWNGQIYVEVPDKELKARIYEFLDGSVKAEGSDRHRVRFRPKPSHVHDLLDGLRAGLTLPGWCDPPMSL